MAMALRLLPLVVWCSVSFLLRTQIWVHLKHVGRFDLSNDYIHPFPHARPLDQFPSHNPEVSPSWSLRLAVVWSTVSGASGITGDGRANHGKVGFFIPFQMVLGTVFGKVSQTSFPPTLFFQHFYLATCCAPQTKVAPLAP